MARSTSMTTFVRRIGDVIGEYATGTLGLLPGEFAIVGTLDTNTNRLYLNVGITRAIDRRMIFAGILQDIRNAFPGSPEILSHINLVVRHLDNLDEAYDQLIVAEDEVDISELLERPRV
jgi:hypothetical protein